MEQELISNTEYKPKITIKDNSKRAEHLIIAFWTLIFATILGLIPGINEIFILDKLNNGVFVDDSTLEFSDTVQALVGFIQTILYIITAVVFLNWFRRAYGNLNRLKIKTQYEENMVGWYFVIPILSLYRPYKTMVEIWEKTQRKAKVINTNYIKNTNSYVIGIWWALFIISNFIGRYLLKSIFKDETIEDYLMSSKAMIISDIFQIIEALTVVYIVNSISKMENTIVEQAKLDGGLIIK